MTQSNNKLNDIPKRCSFFAKIRKPERLRPLTHHALSRLSPTGDIFGAGRFALKSLVKFGFFLCKVWQNYANKRVVRNVSWF